MTALLGPITGPMPGTPEWLEARYTGIGASESGAACGVDPWRTPLELYLLKRKLIDPDEPTEEMLLGLDMEPVIAKAYTRRTGRELRGPLPLLRHAEHAFMLASIDREAHDRIVELKAPGWRQMKYWGETEGTDAVPERYLLQAQQQMAVAGVEICDVCPMFGRELRVYTVERNDDLIASIIEREAELWDRIQRGDPPAPDFGHKSTPDLIKRMYGLQSGSSRELSVAAQAAFERSQADAALIKEVEARRDADRALVLSEMQDAALGRFPDGRQVARVFYKECEISYLRKAHYQLREKKGKE